MTCELKFQELSIGALGAFKPALLAAIDKQDVVTIDVAAGTARADVASVQFIVAARHHAELKSKTLRLATPAQGVLREVLQNAGFLTSDNAERAFWLHQEANQ